MTTPAFDPSPVANHLSRHLGEPIESFDLPGPPYDGSAIAQLSVLHFRSRSPDRTVLVTCGASALEMMDGRRAEAMVLLPARVTRDVVAAMGRMLSLFVTFPERERIAVPFGSIVEMGALLSGVTKMEGLLVMPAFGFTDQLAIVPLSNRMTADIVRLVPIYANEADYAVQFGADRLMELIVTEGLDLADLSRPSANTARDPSRKPSSPSGRRRSFKVS